MGFNSGFKGLIEMNCVLARCQCRFETFRVRRHIYW